MIVYEHSCESMLFLDEKYFLIIVAISLGYDREILKGLLRRCHVLNLYTMTHVRLKSRELELDFNQLKETTRKVYGKC